MFIRHGLGDLVRRVGVASILERAGAMLHWGEVSRSARLEPQQRLRLAFEELGPTFVKLGQMLSLREDLLPPEWTEELAQLRSSAAPVPFDEILPVIEHALGGSPSAVFVDLQRESSGSASIAQVHRARLRDGRAVVLKVRRPGIETKVETDVRLLSYRRAVRRKRDARGAPLPADARGRGVSPLADARARSGRRGAQHRALCAQLPGRPPHPDPARVHPVDEQCDERPGTHRRHLRRRCGGDRTRRPRSEATRAARRRCGAKDDAGGRLLSRRSAPGQRDLSARQPDRNDRLRHDGTAVVDATQPDHRSAFRSRPPRQRANAGSAARLGGRGCGRRRTARCRCR